MPRENKIDKALASLEAEIAVLQLAIAKLKAQQSKTPARRPRPVVAEKSA